MGTLQNRLEARLRCTTDPAEREALARDIDYLASLGTCFACDEPTPDDGTGCTNPECTDGEQNLADDRADHQYHAAADRATMAYYLEHDR